MSTIEIITAGAAIVGAGAYLRWAVTPVRIAYALGKQAAALAGVNQDRS
jgi:hypothetical protein